VDEFNRAESADERWRPILGVEAVLLSVMSMLNGYVRKVRRLAQKSVDFL